MATYVYTGSTWENSDNIFSVTTTVDPRYKKLKKEFLKWCTGRTSKKHVFGKGKITCFGCMGQAKTFGAIKHNKDCAVAIALDLA